MKSSTRQGAFTATEPAALLEARGLSYSYGRIQAVKEVALTIYQGEIFGLLGPNGAGKTTTISCLAGLRSRFQGELYYRGARFYPMDNVRDRAVLGVVPQELALYEELTGRENLTFFGGLSGLKRSDLTEAVRRGLEIAGLTERANDRVGSYSGGMKRRLNLAIGDLHRPRLLILDEPTVGVDPQSRHHIFEALQQLRQETRTILYTTHYMEEAQRLCDRIAIMDEGRVIAVGTATELAVEAGLAGADLEAVFLKLTGKTLRDV